MSRSKKSIKKIKSRKNKCIYTDEAKKYIKAINDLKKKNKTSRKYNKS